MDLLHHVIEKMRHGHHTQMADISSVDLIRNMFENSHANRRQEAIADAVFKSTCHGENYTPPERESEDDVNLIMNSVITDKKTLSKLGKEHDGAGGSGFTPWLLGTLGAAGLAAGLTWYMMDPGEDTNTQNTIRPANPSQIVQ